MSGSIPQLPLPAPQPGEVDFVIVTALEEERDAVLAHLDFRRIEKTGDEIVTYYHASVQTARDDRARYSVVICCLLYPGPIDAAIRATHVVERWRPRHVLMVGIAGGVDGEVALGDVIVADRVADYSSGKQLPDGTREIRWSAFAAKPTLLDSVRDFREDWESAVRHHRPREGTSHRHVGTIASGGDVITSAEAIRQCRATWPKLIGVEMEGGGVASALAQTTTNPGFLMIRGVSDLADGDKNSPATQPWRLYASDVAAAFVAALLKYGCGPSRAQSLAAGAGLTPTIFGYDIDLIAELEALTRERAAPPMDDNPQIASDREDRIQEIATTLTNGVPRAIKGSIVAGAELVRQVGRGKYGVVWQATDLSSGETCAVKIFHADHMSAGLTMMNFRHGVRAMKHLNDREARPKSIVSLWRASADRLAFLMPFLEDHNLRRIRRGWTQSQKVQVFTTLCEAVKFAHDHGVIHRDIKPANVVMHDDGPVLTDFDIADLQFTKTLSADAIGDVTYAAPEQLQKRDTAKPTVDVFSLGRMLHYFLLEAEPELKQDPALVGLADQPRGLVRIIRKCTWYDANRRYQTIEPLLADLARHLSSPLAVGDSDDSPGSNVQLAKVLWTKATTHSNKAAWREEYGSQALATLANEDPSLADQWRTQLTIWKRRYRHRRAGLVAVGAAVLAFLQWFIIPWSSRWLAAGRVEQRGDRGELAVLVTSSSATTARRGPDASQIFGGKLMQRDCVRFNPTEVSIGTLSDAFCIGRTEVSVGNYQTYCPDCPRRRWVTWPKSLSQSQSNICSSALPPKYPVVCVTRSDAEQFCRTQGGRLPTEAEWTAAAGNRKYPWGYELKDDPKHFVSGVANLCGEECQSMRSDAGPRARRATGHHDRWENLAEVDSWWQDEHDHVQGLLGNVAEWVNDANVGGGADTYVALGGSWDSLAEEVSVKTRVVGSEAEGMLDENTRSAFIGFRCVWEP